jgi:hypothetical protein
MDESNSILKSLADYESILSEAIVIKKMKPPLLISVNLEKEDDKKQSFIDKIFKRSKL